MELFITKSIRSKILLCVIVLSSIFTNLIYANIHEHEVVFQIIGGPKTVNVKAFGAIGDGIADDSNAIQMAIDKISESSFGGTVIIPSGTYRIVAKSPTIDNPKRITIRQNNIHIVGVDAPVIFMDGIDVDYLCSINDRKSSGRDVFTAFSFIRTKNCSIKNINFVGTYYENRNFRYKSPRAKCIGFIGVENCSATNIIAENILGNVINCTPSDKTYDGKYQPLKGVKIINCHAKNCWEGAFNFMGNTFNGEVRNCTARECQNGFEGACQDFIISGCIFENNRRTGMAISGVNNIAENNICRGTIEYDDKGNVKKGLGVGVQIAGGKDITLRNNRIEYNSAFGLYIYPGAKNITIVSNTFRDNAHNGVYKYEIYFQNTPDKQSDQIAIIDNKFENSDMNVRSLIVSHLMKLMLKGNKKKDSLGHEKIMLEKNTFNIKKAIVVE